MPIFHEMVSFPSPWWCFLDPGSCVLIIFFLRPLVPQVTQNEIYHDEASDFLILPDFQSNMQRAM